MATRTPRPASAPTSSPRAEKDRRAKEIAQQRADALEELQKIAANERLRKAQSSAQRHAEAARHQADLHHEAATLKRQAAKHKEELQLEQTARIEKLRAQWAEYNRKRIASQMRAQSQADKSSAAPSKQLIESARAEWEAERTARLQSLSAKWDSYKWHRATSAKNLEKWNSGPFSPRRQGAVASADVSALLEEAKSSRANWLEEQQQHVMIEIQRRHDKRQAREAAEEAARAGVSEQVMRRKEEQKAEKAKLEEEKQKASEEATLLLDKLKQWAGEDAEKRAAAKLARLERVRAERRAERKDVAAATQEWQAALKRERAFMKSHVHATGIVTAAGHHFKWR